QTVAAMTALACEVRRICSLPLGINVLRNDGQSALAIATASGASFIRVNILCGARLTDQGIIPGVAHDLLRDRALLQAHHIKILTDIDVKHSVPLVRRSLVEEVSDTLHRGLADALIATGPSTGHPTNLEHLTTIRAAGGPSPLFVGSGVQA